MSHDPLSTVLYDACICLLIIKNALMLDGIERVICTIKEQRRTPKNLMSISPMCIEHPNILGTFHRVVHVEKFHCHTLDNWASAVMLDRVLCSAPENEIASVAGSPCVLEPTFRGPATPQSLKDCCLYSNGHQLRKGH